MGIKMMGKVLVDALVENLGDFHQAGQGSIQPDAIRRVEVSEALVDTGATMLGMPRHLIEQLGLKPLRARRVRTSAGPATMQVYGTVRLTIQGRDCPSDVIELPDDCPVRFGLEPIGLLDLVVDPGVQRLIGNPAHGGEHILEFY